jgi:hypothetical protein
MIPHRPFPARDGGNDDSHQTPIRLTEYAFVPRRPEIYGAYGKSLQLLARRHTPALRRRVVPQAAVKLPAAPGRGPHILAGLPERPRVPHVLLHAVHPSPLEAALHARTRHLSRVAGVSEIIVRSYCCTKRFLSYKIYAKKEHSP